MECIPGGMECHTKCVTDDLKDMAVVGMHDRLQDVVMMLTQGLPRFRLLLRELNTAFDISKEKRYCTCRD